jgi:cell division protein FtsN
MIAAASVVLAAAAIWFGGRASNQSAAPTPAAVQPAPTVPEPASTVAAPEGQVDRELPATTPTTTAPLVANSAGTAATSTGSTGEEFEIVIASFRTTARANGVAADITALGQPVRQRLSNGWQQVLAGPYASEALAREAQQRLERAGFTNTQLVPASR